MQFLFNNKTSHFQIYIEPFEIESAIPLFEHVKESLNSEENPATAIITNLRSLIGSNEGVDIDLNNNALHVSLEILKIFVKAQKQEGLDCSETEIVLALMEAKMTTLQ